MEVSFPHICPDFFHAGTAVEFCFASIPFVAEPEGPDSAASLLSDTIFVAVVCDAIAVRKIYIPQVLSGGIFLIVSCLLPDKASVVDVALSANVVPVSDLFGSFDTTTTGFICNL